MSRFTPMTDDERWAAVLRRDAAADAAFCYAVATTGVYCRPSCPARRPRREHVTFHRSPAEAERAGYRPCRRCRPRAASVAERHRDLVAAACRTIHEAERVPDLQALAAAAGLSRFRFHRIFRETTGLTPRAYAAAHRAGRLRATLTGSRTVTDACYEAGFGSSGRFYAQSTASLGMTPSSFRKGAPGRTIRFAVGECTLGAILVAATDLGLCAILLGDDPEALVHDMQDRFSQATLVGGDREFEEWVAAVVGFVDSPSAGLPLPIDVRGTVFQERVWQALRNVPCGSTTTYAELARRIGQPAAARAVARACAANPLAVAIPCHRVIRQDGSFAGYRWGIDRKRALLARESPGAGNAQAPRSVRASVTR
jgi:AraC family transcriptional regulator of adaptative response/methylated-DNA-[protein]-cysteine methyltransferase